MQEPTFDIFRGPNDKDAVWVEAVNSLSDARKRMEEIAVANPGQYFVSNPFSHFILARIDTRKVISFQARAKSA